jgi:hypothetical protein
MTGSIDHVAADRWLTLAAAPTFAMMALLTRIHGGGMPDMLCPAGLDAWPLSGMVPMYLLMSAFHLAPWLRLLSRRRSGGVSTRQKSAVR